MNLTYGKEVHSQIFFCDLGASERKGLRRQKEGFVVQGGLSSFLKLMNMLQQKLSEEEREMLTYKDNKLTYLLKNLYKDYTRVNIIFHVMIQDMGLEGCLRTLEASDRIRTNPTTESKDKDGKDGKGGTQEDQNEFSTEILIQHLNKENFDLRNQIETMKRSHKIKLEELQQLLSIPCEIDYLLKNKDNAPEMTMIHEQRRAMEKADSLIKANKELERRLEYLASDLSELKRERK